VSTGKRTHRQEKLARIYDDEILPIWAQRFGRMMLRGLELPPKPNVLVVGCGTGYPALEVLRKMDEQGRIIAIDGSSTLLDVARKKAAELSGKRIFFRTESGYPKLPFAADVYDAVLCNLGLGEMPDPRLSVTEFARVAKAGGQVITTLPLAGTWGEFHDIYREVLVKHDKNDMLERLEQHLRTYPEPEEVEGWLTGAGLERVKLDVEEFNLLFRSSREFFFAPVVEHGPLPRWKEIAGKGQELQDVFWYIKQAIDAYFGGRAFQITVKACCAWGVKPAAAARPAPSAVDDATPAPGDDDDDDGEPIDLDTGEVELVEDEEIGEGEIEEIDAFKDDVDPKGRPRA
jgi:ubiquinone/menaquinone biosynthesis C-methylase UbiE